MTSANRESIAFIEEVTWGTTPSTPTGQIVNFTGCTLGSENEATQSSTVRSDTNRVGNIRTGRTVSGDLGFELQYGGHDDFMEGVLRNDWATALAITANTTVSAAASDNSFNGTGLFANAVPGQFVRVSGFSTAANNGYFRVVSKTNDKIVVAGGTLTNEAATPPITIKGAILKNGTTQKSYTVERHFQELTQFLSFTGVRMDTMQLNISTGSIVTGSFATMGKTPARSGSTLWSGTTAAVTTDQFNSVNDLKRVWIDDSLVTTDLTEISFSVGTNSQKRPAIGSLDGEGIIQNSIAVSGTFSEYFENGTLLDKNIDYTDFSIGFVLEDGDGNAYGFSFPKCNITGGKPDNGGIDTQITIPYNFSSVLHPTLGFTVAITRMPV